MAEYYPLIARAVTGLDKNSGEARRALYERARTALVTQLRGIDPPLSEQDITRERLALEEAIRKVEAETARRPRIKTPPQQPEAPAEVYAAQPQQPEAPAEKPAPVAPDIPPPPDWNELQRELEGRAPEPPETLEQAGQDLGAPPAAPDESAEEPPLPLETPVREPPAAELEERPARRNGNRFSERPSIVDEGLKGFRDVMAESEDIGGASATASRSARETREAFAGLPPRGEPDRLEPRFGPEDLQQPQPDRPPPRRARLDRREPPPPPPMEEDHFEEEETDEPRVRSGGRGLKLLMLSLLLIVGGGLAYLAYSQWPAVTGMFQTARAPTDQTSRDAPAIRPKIADRIGGTQQEQATRPSRGTTAAVAQRVVLYEQDPTTQERKQYIGSVIWKTETASSEAGQPADLAIRAEVEIPERHLRMGFTLRRNLDQSLPASHTIEILFSTPADFPPGAIADVPGVLMEDTDQNRGAPLRGLRIKVTTGFFLIGLSSFEADVKYNLPLLKERPWMHIPIVYNNGQRALLALEKGVPGDRVFDDAFRIWGQSPAAVR